MVKVLFVCTGNINRSVMAEAIFRQLINNCALSDKIAVDSAGTDRMHTGEPPYWGTQRVLRAHKVPFDGIFSRQISRQDFENFKYIIVMDEKNIKDLDKMGFNRPLNRLLDYAPETGVTAVEDPSYTNHWEEVFHLIEVSCKKLLEYIKKEENL